ncbi:MAG: hypothetical protein AABZ31_07765 [Bdellovibrionota bacterium]
MDRRQEEDRRKVERFSSPPVREHLRQIAMCLRFLSVLTFSGEAYGLVKGVLSGISVDVAFGVFTAFVFGCITVLMHRYAAGIKDYLFNESVGNLEKAMERQAMFWIVLCFLALIGVVGFFVYMA